MKEDGRLKIILSSASLEAVLRERERLKQIRSKNVTVRSEDRGGDFELDKGRKEGS